MPAIQDILLILYAQLFILSVLCFLKKRQRKKKEGVSERGLYKLFLNSDERTFRSLVRLGPSEFNFILEKISKDIMGKNAHSLPCDLKLLITLHFLAHGSSKLKTSLDFDVAEASVTKIIDEVCMAIIKRIGPEFVAAPTTEEWMKIERGFRERWNVPNMLGAVDGKHCRIQKPENSGSLYYNYKGYFSVVIMAVVDYDYKFRVVDVGGYGSDHDGALFRATPLGNAIYDGRVATDLNWPEDKLVGSAKLPHFLVGDDAFQLNANLMKPYPGRNLPLKSRIYNYRMSRARQIVENTFGILAARWRIFQFPIIATLDRAKTYIYTAIVLHNFLAAQRGDYYIPDGYADKEDKQGAMTPGNYRGDITGGNQLNSLPPCSIRNSSQIAGAVRNSLADYFMTDEGKLDWQERYVNRGADS